MVTMIATIVTIVMVMIIATTTTMETTKIAFPLGILVYPWIIKNNPTLQILKSTPFLLKKVNLKKKEKYIEKEHQYQK